MFDTELAPPPATVPPDEVIHLDQDQLSVFEPVRWSEYLPDGLLLTCWLNLRQLVSSIVSSRPWSASEAGSGSLRGRRQGRSARLPPYAQRAGA
jgi:hypothetical protein